MPALQSNGATICWTSYLVIHKPLLLLASVTNPFNHAGSINNKKPCGRLIPRESARMVFLSFFALVGAIGLVEVIVLTFDTLAHYGRRDLWGPGAL